MPTAKATKTPSDQSYSAAQAKVWKAERSTLLKNAKKVMADFETERRRLFKAVQIAQKALDKHRIKARPKMDRACHQINRRIGILNGKLGL